MSNEESRRWDDFIDSLFKCVKKERVVGNRKKIKIVK
jgi:hypothetical protein